MLKLQLTETEIDINNLENDLSVFVHGWKMDGSLWEDGSFRNEFPDEQIAFKKYEEFKKIF